MTTRPAIFKWRQAEPQLIVCAVRCYFRYSLRLRDIEELLEERCLEVDTRMSGLSPASPTAEARAALADALRILERLGVHLNLEKTRIVHIRFGFEFLGYQIKRGKPRRGDNRNLGRNAPAGSLYAYPREKLIRGAFKEQVPQLTSRRAPVTTQELIDKLNLKPRGWRQY